MFPPSMAAQRDRLVAALGAVVANVDNLDAAVPFLQGLGRDHRKFAVEPGHYPAVGASLLALLLVLLVPERRRLSNTIEFPAPATVEPMILREAK